MAKLKPSPACVELNDPATHFHEAFLLGNGSLGATAYGRPGEEWFDLNRDTLWSGGPLVAESDPFDDAAPSAALPELRAAIAQGDHAAADERARRLQSSGWTESYQPVGRLRWRWQPEGTSTGNYRRVLRLATARAETHAGSEDLVAFVSHQDDMLVVQSSHHDVEEPEFDSPHDATSVTVENTDGLTWLTAVGRAPTRVVPEYERSAHPVVYSWQPLATDGTVAAGMGWAVVAAVQHVAGGTRLLATVETGFRGWNQRPSADLTLLASRARSRVTSALVRETSDLAERHERDYRSLFDRVRLDLTPSGDQRVADAQRYFDFGRYLLISCSRPGTQAANLQGIWNQDVRPGWCSDYTTNINAEMNYWGAESTALPESHEPLFDLISELTEAGQATADTLYGARGAVVHHNTDLWRFSAPVHGNPQWANWSMGLTWMSAHLGMRLDAEWSEEFARTRALPVFRQVGAFVLDQLVEDAGGLVVSPSSSPEHSFRDERGMVASVTAGATLDQELARESLWRLAELCERLGERDELSDRANAAIDRLRMPSIDMRGRISEWAPGIQPTEPGHRHFSHLYGVFPGGRITPNSAPEEFEAVRRALAYRLENGSGHTGWSQAWVLCLAARLRDAPLAMASIEVLVHELSSPSLLCLHPHADRPGGALFQIDGNLGAVAGITEMLVQSHDGAISLLPTLPAAWSAGSVSGLRVRGGRTVDIVWSDGGLVSATISSTTAEDIVIEVADGLALAIRDETGRVLEPSRRAAAGGRVRWQWTMPAHGLISVVEAAA